MDSSLVVALVALGMAIGLAGTLLPVVPGLSLVWLCGLAYGLSEGFGRAGTVLFAVMTVLCILGIIGQYVLPGRAASEAGASGSSLVLGVLFAVIGFFVIPVIGLPVGGVAGIFAGELLRTGDTSFARRATWATVKGFGVGVLVQLATGMAMVIAWVIWVLL